MFTVALPSRHVHDALAVPLRDQPVGRPGVTVLAVLLAVAIVLFRALRAAVAAIVALLLPTLTLLRMFVLVVGLAAAVGVGLVTGPDDAEDGPVPAPSTTQHPLQPLGSLLPPRPTR